MGVELKRRASATKARDAICDKDIRHPREDADPVLRVLKSWPLERWTSEWIENVRTPIFRSLDPRPVIDTKIPSECGKRRGFAMGVVRHESCGFFGSTMSQSITWMTQREAQKSAKYRR